MDLDEMASQRSVHKNVTNFVTCLGVQFNFMCNQIHNFLFLFIFLWEYLHTKPKLMSLANKQQYNLQQPLSRQIKEDKNRG